MNDLIRELRDLAKELHQDPTKRTCYSVSAALLDLVDKHDKPVVEYVEGDEITDDMLQGGRLPCEVRDEPTEEWKTSILLYTSEDTYCRFYTTKGGYEHCRIKKSDLPEANE